MAEGVDGLLRNKTQPPGTPPLKMTLVDKVVALTLESPAQEATHRTVGGSALFRPLCTFTFFGCVARQCACFRGFCWTIDKRRWRGGAGRLGLGRNLNRHHALVRFR